MRRVQLAGELARFLLLNRAQGFEEGESVIGQDDGLGIIGVLLPFDPACLG